MSSQPHTSKQQPDNDTTQLVEKLLNEIAVRAKKGDFNAAGSLREKLLETAPMAINEAILSAEIIEKAMSAAIDKDHLAMWSELYDTLSKEESSCLFHSLIEYTVPAKRLLLNYGSLNDRLFFLEKGKVNVCLPKESDKYKILAQLGHGSVIGEYTFASIALCSATAVTATEVQIRCLEKKSTEKWAEKHPGLYEKLLTFCKQHGQIDQISERKDREPHTHPRYPIQGQVNAVLLDHEGNQTETRFLGEMAEISSSGTSFTIQCSKQATVEQLLARSLSLSFSCLQNDKQIKFTAVGRVVHVSFLLYSDYLLHLGFQTPLSEELDKKLAPVKP